MTTVTNKRFLTAGVLINDVAVDVGLESASDPVANTSQQFIQLTRQLSIACEELAEVAIWEMFKREHSFTTDSGTYADGEYDLPSDFHFMIDQTQWDRTNDVPMGGPLSSQDWQYLLGRDLVSSTIYASFRQQEGKLALWPAPPADGLVIAFEYASTNWIRNTADDGYVDRVEMSGDTILFPPSLIRSYLKAKWLESKGFATADPQQAVALFLNTGSGKDRGAPILKMGGRRTQFPYLNRNVPDTGYGS
jgi:hypothetical protein